MKKLLLVLAGLLIVVAINAQSIEEIVKKYSSVMKSDKLAAVSSLKITGKMSAMGMEMPMVMIMKNPNKIKVTYSFNGQDMVSVFDGEKGYMVNPMMGSSNPVELTGDQLKQVQDNNPFKNVVLNYFKNGQLTLEGQENVNDKPAFKLKANAGKSPVYLFVDKDSYMLVKTSATMDQMGTSMNIDSYMTDYVDIDGVIMPKKTTAMANGMEAGIITFDKIEVNIPVDDSVFRIK
jgi:outer membrane lipoprotein-sorting protein